MTTKININKIKKYIQEECAKPGNYGIWFYNTHLLAVEKSAKILLEKFPKAKGEVVMLGVWLHDLQRIRCVKGDHQKIGALEAEKVLNEFGANQKLIKEVKEIILSHSCERKKPANLEAKILSTADAMSHYMNDFYLDITIRIKKDIKKAKKFVLTKTEKDYNKKIYFDFARKMVKKQHEALRFVFKNK